jgi:hypothetical protein
MSIAALSSKMRITWKCVATLVFMRPRASEHDADEETQRSTLAEYNWARGKQSCCITEAVHLGRFSFVILGLFLLNVLVYTHPATMWLLPLPRVVKTCHAAACRKCARGSRWRLFWNAHAHIGRLKHPAWLTQIFSSVHDDPT